MDGMVYDRLGKLAYIEVKGACNARQWLTLCRAVCGLAVETPPDPKSDQVESGFHIIDQITRVHRVVEGDWTTAYEIASQLALHRIKRNS